MHIPFPQVAYTLSSEHRGLGLSVGAAVLLAASALVPSRATTQPPGTPLDRLIGSYRFVGGEKERTEVARAIDEAVDELNVFIRGIARRRLREPNLPSEGLRIVAENGRVTVARTGQPAISAPADGRVVSWENPKNGNELDVAHRMTPDGRLEQILQGDRGRSKNVFDLGQGGRLIVHTTVEAEKLPSTIRFSTTYARRGANSGAR